MFSPSTTTGTSTDLPAELERERRLAVATWAAPGPTARPSAIVGRERRLDHPRGVDRLARGEPAGDQELDVGEPVVSRISLGWTSSAASTAPLGKVSVSTASSCLGATAATGAFWATEVVSDRDRGEFLDDRAGLGVDQPDDAVAAGGGQDLAVGPERDRVDAALADLDAWRSRFTPALWYLSRAAFSCGRAGGDHLLLDRLDVGGQGGVELVVVDGDLAEGRRGCCRRRSACRRR